MARFVICRLCRYLVAHTLGIEGTRQLVHVDEVPLQAFLVVRAGIEDLPVAVLAPDLLRFLQGHRATKQQAHGDQRDAYLGTFAHVPPPDFEDHRRLLLLSCSCHARASQAQEAISWPERRRKNSGFRTKGTSKGDIVSASSSKAKKLDC